MQTGEPRGFLLKSVSAGTNCEDALNTSVFRGTMSIWRDQPGKQIRAFSIQ